MPGADQIPLLLYDINEDKIPETATTRIKLSQEQIRALRNIHERAGIIGVELVPGLPFIDIFTHRNPTV